MPDWQELWATPLLWNTVGQWALALAAFLITFTVLPLVKGYIDARRRKRLSQQRTLPTAIEVATLLVDRTTRVFLWIVALYFGISLLNFPPPVERAMDYAIVLMFWIQVAIWAMAVVRFFIDRRQQRIAPYDRELAGSIQIILFITGLTIWTMAFLLALDNLGIEIKPLLAGLGIGGIAVALAVQTVLGDLLASLSIALDKPFKVGESLSIDDFNGTVEYIGVKSTRLRSVSGEQIVMSNADILRSRIRNFGRMNERRAVFQISVTYNTPVEKLRAIPAAVREIVESQPNARFDRCHFLQYSDWALRFEIVYYVTVPDYTAYADVQQAINLAILERFQAMGVQFAFPQRPIYSPPQTI